MLIMGTTTVLLPTLPDQKESPLEVHGRMPPGTQLKTALPFFTAVVHFMFSVFHPRIIYFYYYLLLLFLILITNIPGYPFLQVNLFSRK